ncbi:hypothetical protein EPYR_03656 [Erwinia pyrifoliae DSM 12163]|nr:hypothetical protein EPYR_03656 [Erwinia pyrifoliae DSM 12163]
MVVPAPLEPVTAITGCLIDMANNSLKKRVGLHW